jgi:ribosome biogenesis protein BMS1
VVTSKRQRLTFLECPNELEAMVDVAKVADAVLLMINGNFGFEMETLEFLNILSSIGMPGNIFGVLTHLDLFRKPQALKDAKKRLKHRLWTELYQGAHLFNLSGVINGRYPDREVHNLSRFLSTMKNTRPLIWRNSHPYAIMDSFRDVTHPTKVEDDELCDRSIVLSGYLRGTNFASQGQRVHIAGLGDFTVASVEALPDPCPTPSMQDAISKATGKLKRRGLDEKDKKLYAPMSDRSGLKVDGDAIYIYREKGFTFDKDATDVERGEGEELIINLQGERRLLGQTDGGIQLFAGSEQLKDTGEDDPGHQLQRAPRLAVNLTTDEDDALANGDSASESSGSIGSNVESFLSEDDLSESDYDDYNSDEEAANVKWKESLKQRAERLHSQERPARVSDLARMLYDESIPIQELRRHFRTTQDDGAVASEENNDEGDEDFFEKSKQESAGVSEEDRVIPVFDYESLAQNWTPATIEDLRQRRFATGHSVNDDTPSGEDFSDGDDPEDAWEDDDGESGEGEDDEGDGAFEDLETGEQHGPSQEDEGAASPTPLTYEEERAAMARRKEELKLRFEEEDREGFLNPKAKSRQDGPNQDEFGEDEWYEAQKAMMQKQLDINKDEYERLDERQRVAVEGFKAGTYAKIAIEGIPAEFVKLFKARLPLLVGGLAATEDRFGLLQARIKRHRWHKRILKTNDPLIFSLGWRRFQTMPIYSLSDSRTRSRWLKYTPEHMHCFSTFYGPLIAPNTGFVCFQSFSAANRGFRVAATGTVLTVDESTEIVKKLKLVGAPYKIFKNTAFIKDMFNSALEVTKFEGAAIRTVSGIRGQIKRALSKPEGHFRATFEDKVLMSDIVFLRAWVPVQPQRFYNPVTNLLGWHRMRLTGEIRRDEGLDVPQQKNSQYRPVERTERQFAPLRVPRKLAASLPFKSQIVQTKKQKKETYMQKRAVVLGGEERRARDLMHKLTTIRKDVAEKRKAKKAESRAAFLKVKAIAEEKRLTKEKEQSKEYWSREGKKRKPGDGGGGGGKRRK